MKEYIIDVTKPAADRWAEVIARESDAARKLVAEAASKITLPRWTAEIFRHLYNLSGGLYRGEIDAWAKALGVKAGVVTAAQCSYELAMVGGYVGEVFGCTSAVIRHPKFGLTHVRYLDWDLPGMSKATRIFRFKLGHHEAVVVGVVGFVGALSGYVPGAYSVTINQAPFCERPSFNLGAAFLAREVLTTKPTYDEAVEALCDTPVAAPVLFTVCGTDRACVIERKKEEYRIHHFHGAPLVVTNHFRSRDWRKDNDEDADSIERYDLTHELLRKPKGTYEGLLHQIQQFPIESDITVQKMLFCPARKRHIVEI